MAVAQVTTKLLDFSQPVDVELLESTVGLFYGAGTQDQVLPAALVHSAPADLRVRLVKQPAAHAITLAFETMTRSISASGRRCRMLLLKAAAVQLIRLGGDEQCMNSCACHFRPSFLYFFSSCSE